MKFESDGLLEEQFFPRFGLCCANLTGLPSSFYALRLSMCLIGTQAFLVVLEYYSKNNGKKNLRTGSNVQNYMDNVGINFSVTTERTCTFLCDFVVI